MNKAFNLPNENGEVNNEEKENNVEEMIIKK